MEKFITVETSQEDVRDYICTMFIFARYVVQIEEFTSQKWKPQQLATPDPSIWR